MKLVAFIITTLQAAAYVASLNLPVNPGGLNLGKDHQQYKACKAANPATTFAGIRYGDGPPETVAYHQCVPWRKDGKIIANAVFCQPATCFVFSDEECKIGPSVPIPVIVPVPIDFLNVVNFVELLGASAYCTPNTLPRLPL